MSENSSSKLLRRYLAGSENAPFELHSRYQNRLIGLARKQLMGVLQSKVDAEDISQEAFHAFFDLADQDEIRWQKRGDLWRLLAGIAINKIKQKFDHYSAEKRNSQNEIQLNAGPHSQALLPDEKAKATELAELVEHILVSEKPLTKTVVEFRLAGFTHKQIAEKVGRSTRTIRRILDSLQAKLISENEFGLTDYFQSTTSSSPDSNQAIEKTRYEDFQLLTMVGQGSFAKVYLARQIETGRLFAIKAIKKRWLSNAAVRQTFQREAQLLQQLNHANIVTCFGIGNLPNGGSFLQLEYVEGFSLERAAQDASGSQISTWLKQLTSAVNTIHASGVVHGDLRPANVMVDLKNMVRIVDFGLGIFAAEKSKPNQKSDLTGLESIKNFLDSRVAKS